MKRTEWTSGKPQIEEGEWWNSKKDPKNVRLSIVNIPKSGKFKDRVYASRLKKHKDWRGWKCVDFRPYHKDFILRNYTRA